MSGRHSDVSRKRLVDDVIDSREILSDYTETLFDFVVNRAQVADRSSNATVNSAHATEISSNMVETSSNTTARNNC